MIEEFRNETKNVTRKFSEHYANADLNEFHDVFEILRNSLIYEGKPKPIDLKYDLGGESFRKTKKRKFLAPTSIFFFERN